MRAQRRAQKKRDKAQRHYIGDEDSKTRYLGDEGSKAHLTRKEMES